MVFTGVQTSASLRLRSREKRKVPHTILRGPGDLQGVRSPRQWFVDTFFSFTMVHSLHSQIAAWLPNQLLPDTTLTLRSCSIFVEIYVCRGTT